MSRKKSITGLEQRIGYRFADKKLLENALTHVTAAKGARKASYQRLEFLGDHVLGLVVSELLYRGYPKAEEGELSQRLADLVRKETCAEVALEIELGQYIRLGGGEAQAGGRQKTTLLADVCEAVIGAVFLDGGYEAAVGAVGRLWRERMIAAKRPRRDAKTILQEWAQGRGLPPPYYRELERSGPHHRPLFRVVVELPDMAALEGSGSTKREAEQAAAAAMLACMKVAGAGGDV